MPNIVEWIDDQIALDLEAVKAGDGSHPQEGKALKDYLSGKTSPEKASEAITSPVLAEKIPGDHMYRVWGLLANALVELEEEREKLYELMRAIQNLPYEGKINFKSLCGFHSMWFTLYRLHFHGPAQWEKSKVHLSAVTVKELREHSRAVGVVEATMFVRGIGDIPVEWGLNTVNLLLTKTTRSLDVYIGSIHAWIVQASEKLLEGLEIVEDNSSRRPHRDDRRGWKHQQRYQHWANCKDSLLHLGAERSQLSVMSKELALECYTIIDGELIKLGA